MSDAQQLGRWLERLRLSRRWTRTQMHAAGGPAPRHQLTLLHGEVDTVRQPTIDRIAAVSGYTPDEIASIMDGADLPIPRTSLPDVAAAPDEDEVRAEVSRLRTEVAELAGQVRLLARMVTERHG